MIGEDTIARARSIEERDPAAYCEVDRAPLITKSAITCRRFVPELDNSAKCLEVYAPSRAAMIGEDTIACARSIEERDLAAKCVVAMPPLAV
jgi:hypothetical protein